MLFFLSKIGLFGTGFKALLFYFIFLCFETEIIIMRTCLIRLF